MFREVQEKCGPERITDSLQAMRCIEFALPEGPVYSYLEGLILPAGVNYLKLVQLLEEKERETINKEIALRRSRLTSTPGNIPAEVKSEVYQSSRVCVS